MFTEGQKKIAEGKKQVHVAQVKAEKGQKKIDEGEVKTHKAVSALLAIRTLLVEISSYYRKMHEVKKEKQSRTEAAELGDPESISWMTTFLEKKHRDKDLEEMKEEWIAMLTSQGIEREANKVKYQAKGLDDHNSFAWKIQDAVSSLTRTSDGISRFMTKPEDDVLSQYAHPALREESDNDRGSSSTGRDSRRN
eukprot:gnl/TRDRNA2_/TRDRNA2_175877_c1_seq25.p1 gnl/TRDRNA2_/TRDRNA2_175877_c1~~gnl/TRDRNA2_/TRDRNA2_175877_c1_seq25.p1  ORF type:complete len:194 (+),score=42.34 gnl/TRDRNA2_/TRDRNA2_175877_c1_seq25:376-957(+)